MHTLMIRKSDNVVAAFMSTETTAENMLGQASSDEYIVCHVEKELIPPGALIGATVQVVDGKVTKISSPTIPTVQTDTSKIDYAAAKTDSERIAVIARKLGLEG